MIFKAIITCFLYLLLQGEGTIFNSDIDNDSIYFQAFLIIKQDENCISSKLNAMDSFPNIYLSTEILGLSIYDSLDYFKDDSDFLIGLPKTRSTDVIEINEKLYNYNYLHDDVFYDKSTTKYIVYFSEITNNFFMAEVYLFNYFPVLFLNGEYNYKKNIEYNKLYKNIKENNVITRFYFKIENRNIKEYKCK